MTTFGVNAFGVGTGRDRFTTMVELAREAEEIGCAAVWTSELYSRSATVPMAMLAAGTETISIGTNIAYGVGRSPLMWAAEARDLDELSGGRIILGIGNGTPKMMEAWHGVSGEAPAERMAELLTVLKKLWRLHEGPVHHDGRFYHVHLSPTSDVPEPVRPEIPIWIAGVNKLMLRTAGQHADGLVGHPMYTADYVRGPVAEEVARGAAESGRDPSEITIMGIRMCAIDDDVDTARRQAAYAIGQYAASRVYDRLFAIHGWSAEQERIRQAARDRDTDGVIAAVTDDMIDTIAIACTPEEFPDALARIPDGFDHLDLIAPPWGLTDEQTRAINTRILAGLRRHLNVPAQI
ncbi:LLM class flavin-dependent oxidoreductase [Gordonia desulfuricans]|uniref:LLM class flavin-dependent oxidoreductase n=1 Tax=Gordonia desulfuricans TaxID=89051 RepID=A0A7K3LLM8_9ACTN|nr:MULTISPECIES: LLM class flavin-dependent oxidoreductase [Gordonia]EMP14973.1 F420-dependent oxidoreductase [Gordonia sp. NB41Y]NDK89128.1 LLM class flavin-dependent oxidoreductase [Gordonia desulfuricans]WLP89025.1 LLM class flavin-dependent oxidoreductase [Gordonia sp. NB41Y]